MSDSFRVYIDEAGDEGFIFKPDGSGSSRWLVLSALVIRRKNDLALVECLREVRTLLKKEPNFPLHFTDLKHEQRVAYIRKISGLPIRLCSVLIYKPAIREKEKFQNQNARLYYYATRYLLERVSWLCRDHRKLGGENSFADIIFSNRANMSYDELRAYLLYLKANSGPLQVTVDWSVIDPKRVRSMDHAKLAGLQAADAVASGFYNAARTNQYGDNEPRYAQMLMTLVYRHAGAHLGYGLKFWPEPLEEIKKANPHLAEFAFEE